MTIFWVPATIGVSLAPIACLITVPELQNTVSPKAARICRIGGSEVAGIYLMFGGFAMAGFVVTLLFAVETRGRMLEELSPSVRK